MNDAQEEAREVSSLSKKKTINHYLRKWYYGCLYWIHLYIWCRYCYRHVMRLLHKFNLHYTTAYIIRDDDKNYIMPAKYTGGKNEKQHLWCQWCGLRGDIIKYNNKD